MRFQNSYPNTQSALQRAIRHNRSIQFRSAIANVATSALAMLLVIAMLDIVIPLHGFLRGLTLALIALSLVTNLRRFRREAVVSDQELDEAATAADAALPQYQGVFINAVQFQRQLALNSGGAASQPLMLLEMKRADSAANDLELDGIYDPAGYRAAKRRLLTVIVGLLLGLFLVPRAIRFELPRLFLFWRDTPPFTLTNFKITPEKAQAPLHGEIVVRAELSGRIPETLELLVRDASGKITRSPMLPIREATFESNLEDITSNLDFSVVGSTGRSEWHRIEVLQPPKVLIANAEIEEPNQPKLTVAIHPHQPNAIASVRGATLALTLTTASDIKSVQAEFINAETNQATAIKPTSKARSIRLQTQIERGGDIRLSLTGANGQSTIMDRIVSIKLKQDPAPQVRIVVPGRNVIATPTMAIPIVAEANDDVGVSSLTLELTRNKQPPSTAPLPLQGTGDSSQGKFKLNLSSVGAVPGDVIQYRAIATDIDQSGSHETCSPSYWVWIVSPTDYQKAIKLAKSVAGKSEKSQKSTSQHGEGPPQPGSPLNSSKIGSSPGQGMPLSLLSASTGTAQKKTGPAGAPTAASIAKSGSSTETHRTNPAAPSGDAIPKSSGVPSEYRTLVKDYFNAVGRGK